jgi:Immunoglobulin I-set domain
MIAKNWYGEKIFFFIIKNSVSKINFRKKNDILLKEVDEFKNHHFKMDDKTGKLTIDKAREEDAGNYTCSLNDEVYKFEAQGLQI